MIRVTDPDATIAFFKLFGVEKRAASMWKLVASR